MEVQAQQKTEQIIKQNLVTLDMTIGDVISKYPSTIEVLLRNGVHCVGCGAKTFESIGDGLLGHGFDEQKINRILTELNDSIEVVKDQGEVQITTKAADKLKEMIEKNNKQGSGMRVQVVPGGCAGFQYGFDFETQKKEDDTVLVVNGVEFYIDSQSMMHLRGARIDYIDTLQESGFRISNPNASSGCGCGKSFS